MSKPALPPTAADAADVPDASADIAAESGSASYRSGAAARLSGVPVETLRVWERRYAVTAPQRSAHQQRLYSFDDVRRLGMIKQLVDLGNQIGAIARLSIVDLAAMLELARRHGAPVPAPVSAPARPGSSAAAVALPRLAVVGATLARRLGEAQLAGAPLLLARSCDSLDGAGQALLGAAVDLLVIEVPEMTEPALGHITTLQQASGAQAVLMLYRFCSAKTLRLWRKAGHVLLRMPCDAYQLADACQRVFQHPAAPGQPAVPPRAAAPAGAALPERQLDDQALEALAAASNSLACECPRHLVDILQTLDSFARYAAQCENRNPGDAELHRDLHRTATRGRELFEQALLRLAIAEGLPLPETALRAG